jgi:hypothetical protein
MSKRDISAGVRARQLSSDLWEPDPAPEYVAIEVPAALVGELEEQLLRLNRAAQDAGRTGFTKRRFIELALRQAVRTPPAELLESDG